MSRMSPRRPPGRPSRHGLGTVALAAAVAVATIQLTVTGESAADDAAPVAATTYANPVSSGTVDTFPDPSVVRGHDGDWYAVGTTNPILVSQGDDTEHILPVLRSTDLVRWTYTGDVFTAARQPSWWPARTRLWAPDLHYVDGSYHLTYGLSGGGIGLATSPTPTGPWTDRGRLVPDGGSGCPTFDIDQSLYTDVNGDNYLYWGSFDTICVARMNSTATALTGTPTVVGRGRGMEGAFVVRRDARYYLFYSDSGCCAGGFSGYTVKVGRSTSPLGPFTTPTGVDLRALTSMDGIVLTGTGNRWVGTGHNSLQTDLAGQDWLVYHAIDADHPTFGPVRTTFGTTITGLSRRPLMIDRLDWIDGWPVVRAGAGASTGPQTAPVTVPSVGSTFNAGIPAGWSGNWSAASGVDAGTFLRSPAGAAPSYALSPRSASGDIRVEGDLRFTTTGDSGAAGLVIGRTGTDDSVVAWLDRGQRQLLVTVAAGGATRTYRAALPAGFAYTRWHNIAAERRGNTLVTSVTADRQRNAVATVTVTLPAATASAPIGAAASGAQVDADNLNATALYQPITTQVPEPALGTALPAYSDEFSGSGQPDANPVWRWVRKASANPQKSGGQLVWPTAAGDLKAGTNTAPVLLRDAPTGNYVIEAKLTFDGTTTGPFAGITLYDTDNAYTRLTHSVIPLARGNGAVVHVSEFGKETTSQSGNPGYGPMFGGPTASTMWLRLAHRNDTGQDQHDIRMATSTDGEHWTWGGTWSLPNNGPLKIALLAANGTGATARFDYLRAYTLA